MEEGRSNEAAAIVNPKEEEEEEKGGFKFIPEEIVLNILPNLPTGTLLRFRCVSKQWSRPISPGITQLRKVIVSGNQPFLFRSVDENAQVENIEIELDKTFTWHHPNVFPCIYCSCDGFLLVGVGINLFLWNPSTRRVHGMLTYSPLLKYRKEKVITGLCFDSADNDYKVVLGLNHRDEMSVWMGSFKAKSWSRVNFSYDVGNFKSGPTLDNYVYWWSTDEIIYFDPEIDNFKKILLQQEINNFGGEIMGLGVLDRCLCVALGSKQYSTITDVLGRRQYGKKVSWELIFTFKSYEVERRFYGDERYLNLTHLMPLVFTSKSRVLIHVRRTEYEQHFFNSDCEEYASRPVKLRDEYAVVEYDIHNNLSRDIAVSKVVKTQPFEWPVVYVETLVRPIPPRYVGTTNNSTNKEMLPCQGKQLWKVKENETKSTKSENEEEKNAAVTLEEEKWEVPRRRRGKKYAAAFSSVDQAMRRGNAFDLLNE